MYSKSNKKYKINYFKQQWALVLAIAFLFSNTFNSVAQASFLKGKSGNPNAGSKEDQVVENDKAQNSDDESSQDNSKKIKSTAYADAAVRHFNHGSELHQAGFLNQAIGEYKEAIAADNRIEEAYSNLGIVYTTQHNYPKAKEAFQEALRLRPNRPTTLNGLGTVLYAEGKTTEAMQKWEEALVADPKFASAYYNMGNAYEGQKNAEKARDCYLKAIAVMPNMADAYFRLGNILSKEHHLPQAELLLSKSIELSPDGEFVREAKHSLSIIENRFDKSKAKNLAPRKKQ